MIVFLSGNLGLWSEQVQSVQSVQKVADSFYTMDYTYDYDIDRLLECGVSNHVQLVLDGVSRSLFGSKRFGCTTFNAVNQDGEYLFARNYDYMDSPYLLVWTHPENGYASLSSVSLYFLLYNDTFLPEDELTASLTLLAPYIPVDGMNEKGLSIGVLELETPPTFQVTTRPNLTTTAMIRAVLDKCATVDEAIEMFRTHDMRDLLLDACSYHYQIADAKGNTAVIEYANGKMQVLRPEKNKKNAVDSMVAANYHLIEGVRDPNGMGQERAEIVQKALDKTKNRMSEKQAMQVLQNVSMKDKNLHGYICSTLWSAVYNTKDLTLNVCVNNDYKHTYSFSLKKPQVVKK